MVIETIEALLAEAEALSDPRAKGLARRLASSMTDLLSDGLQRVLELARAQEGGEALVSALADDHLVGNLLVLCGMNPRPPAVRAAIALDAIRGELARLGVRIDGVEPMGKALCVRIAALGTFAEDRVRALVLAAVESRAPDVDTVLVDLPVPPAQLVPLETRTTRTTTGTGSEP